MIRAVNVNQPAPNLPGELAILNDIPGWIYGAVIVLALCAVLYLGGAIMARVFTNHNPPIGGKAGAVFFGMIIAAGAAAIVNLVMNG